MVLFEIFVWKNEKIVYFQSGFSDGKSETASLRDSIKLQIDWESKGYLRKDRFLNYSGMHFTILVSSLIVYEFSDDREIAQQYFCRKWNKQILFCIFFEGIEL